MSISRQKLLEERFIERNLCEIDIIGEIIDSVLLWNCVQVRALSNEHCTVLSGHRRLYEALGMTVMFASIIRISKVKTNIRVYQVRAY